MPSFRISVTLACAVVAPLALGAPPSITEAEKAACEIVAGHLAHGPQSVIQHLATSSPLSDLDAAAVRSEIAARLGPPEGTSWELRTTAAQFAEHGATFHVVFPSGAEDVVVFDLVREQEQWKVDAIRTLAEPLDVPRRAGPQSPVSAIRQEVILPAPGKLLILLVAPLLAIAGGLTRQRLPRTSSLVLLLAFAVFVVPVTTEIDLPMSRPKRAPQVAPRKSSYIPMADLAAARRAYASGTAIRFNSSETGPAEEIAALWTLAAPGNSFTPEQRQTRLAAIRLIDRAPLVFLLRAREAVNAGRYDDAARGYRSLRATGPAHDAFWIEEMVTSFAIASDDRARRATLPRADDSRDSELLYTHSIAALVSGNPDGARAAFQQAWHARPATRSDLVSDGYIGFLLRDPAMSLLVNLRSPHDEVVSDPMLSFSPMAAPSGARALATGAFVRLIVGESRLDIPGGATIAPLGSETVSSESLERTELSRSLRRAEKLEAPDLASKTTQRIVEKAVEALGERNRWDRVLALTDAIRPDSDNVPASLLSWRIRALVRGERFAEAKDLATGGAVRRATRRKPDPGVLLEISELLAEARAWDDAIMMVRTAASLKDAPDVSMNLRHLDLRRELAGSAPAITTTHFDIHTTTDVPITVASRISDLLEAELERLMPLFRLREFRRVRVNVVRWDQFRSNLTGSDHIAGFYDGDITVPFGEVARFREGVVSILTHELAHAVLAQASQNTVPRWLHEGIATRMELVEEQENLFAIKGTPPPYALELLDAILERSFDGVALREAYVTAHTFVRFLEERHGPDTINRLIEAFRGGRSTEEALSEVTGQSVQQLDGEFRAWGTVNRNHFVDRSPWPYARFQSLGIDPRIREAIRFSRPREKRP